ncbi:hypothetical protein QS306_16960 [Paraburkholderia bonniea]|uniref:hypothetical protein n=1 Tax=Paraburkholderia bonniea TaxID=2152891 RepID=UPI001FE79BE2|nr:hypothetical protein [Paraburkholderia bonniea]WJF91760.1 hypothetical protein QS306_16960 [Paraburkholderia bonniea]WJF95080.1 hypothetical protein QS308_16965 [Paraburkholderia bonniea]
MKLAQLIFRSAWLGCAWLSTAALADSACDKRPVKAERTEVFGQNLLVNGVPTTVLGQTFAGSPEEVIAEFRAFWRKQQVPAMGRRNASGMLLSALDTSCHYVLTIPLKATGGRTKGILSVTRLGGEAPRRQIPDRAVPLPDSAHVISDVESHDPAQAGRTWLIQLPGQAAGNAERYQARLAAQGWSTVAQAPSYKLDGSQRVVGRMAMMQRGDDHVDAIFSDQGGQTQAVINATRNR